jgi:hypothetical protein
MKKDFAHEALERQSAGKPWQAGRTPNASRNLRCRCEGSDSRTGCARSGRVCGPRVSRPAARPGQGWVSASRRALELAKRLRLGTAALRWRSRENVFRRGLDSYYDDEGLRTDAKVWTAVTRHRFWAWPTCRPGRAVFAPRNIFTRLRIRRRQVACRKRRELAALHVAAMRLRPAGSIRTTIPKSFRRLRKFSTGLFGFWAADTYDHYSSITIHFGCGFAALYYYP